MAWYTTETESSFVLPLDGLGIPFEMENVLLIHTKY